MNRERLDNWCGHGIFAVVIAILIFGPLATGAVRTLEFLILQSLTVIALVLWLVRLWLKPCPQFLMPPLGWGVVAFTVYAIARYWNADIEFIARQELIRVLVYASLFFIVVNNLHAQEAANRIGFVMLFLAMGITFYAVYQFFTGDNHVWHFENTYHGRGTGTYINPNHFAGFLELLLPLGIAYTIVGRMKPVFRVLIGYATAMILVGIAISVSRGAWIATTLTLIGFFVVLLFHRGFRLPALLALVAVTVAVVVAAPKSAAIQQRFQIAAKEAGSKEYTRYQLWLPALELWREDKWLGIGPGHFNSRFRAVRPQEIQTEPDRAHNDYLNTLVDWGIIGLALVLASLTALTLGIIKAWRHVGGVAADLGNRRSNRFAFVLGGSFGLVALLIHSATDFNMHIPANAILAVTLMALLAAHQRFSTERWWFNARLPLVATVSLLLIATIGYLGHNGFKRADAYVWLNRAQAEGTYSPQQSAALERAFAAEPGDSEIAYKIGECYRIQSWEGGDNYAELATQAITWYSRAEKLNPYDNYSALRHGMCLDWLGRTQESWEKYSRAEELDPNGYYTVAHIGWHFVQLNNYAAARAWFERSLRLEPDVKKNPIADTYLALCNRRLLEDATDDSLSRHLRMQKQ